MNIDQKEQLIWTYLDGLCTPSENALITSLLESDTSFKKQYLQLKGLHESMIQLPLEKAPADLIDVTIQKLDIKTKSSFKPNPLMFFMAAMAILTCVIIVLPSSESSILESIPGADGLGLPVSLDWSIISSMTSYLIVLAMFPILALADHFIQKNPKLVRVG